MSSSFVVAHITDVCGMAPRMCALAHTHGQEWTRACLKYIEASTTIAVGNMDVDIALLMKLRRFIEDECIAGCVM